jgi:transposase
MYRMIHDFHSMEREMIEIEFSNEQVNQLRELHLQHPHPVVRCRALTLVLKSQNIAHHKIADTVGLCTNTVREYFGMYQQGGIDQLTMISFRKPESKLAPFKSIIIEYFEKTPPSTMAQACFDIEKLIGVSIKTEAMRRYVKFLGLKYRKVGAIPAKADIDAQQKYYDEQLKPRLDEAKAGKRQVYFVDAAHFVLGAFLSYLWSFVRVFVRTPCGRQRFNVLGALNAITKKIITVTNDSYITSIQVCELLRKLAVSTTLPITLVLDNARYQRCHLVMDLAKELGIELLFLPAYSPNLNLIERLWKLVKKECLNSRYYENFPLFRNAIQAFLDTMNDTHQKKLASLLTLEFQTFNENQFKFAA